MHTFNELFPSASRFLAEVNKDDAAGAMYLVGCAKELLNFNGTRLYSLRALAYSPVLLLG